MIKMIYKFHSIFQRLVVVEHQIENVYELTKQCQRIYEKDIQIDKSKRIVNRINMHVRLISQAWLYKTAV